MASQDFVKNNAEYAATFGEKGALPLKPGKKLAIGQWSSPWMSLWHANVINSDMHGRTSQVRPPFVCSEMCLIALPLVFMPNLAFTREMHILSVTPEAARMCPLLYPPPLMLTRT